MTPVPASLHSVELIRDGGSYAAVFEAKDGVTYQLWFPIARSSQGSGSGSISHEAPVLGVEVIIYRNGMRVGHDLKDELMLSWEAARDLLEQFRPLLGGQSEYSRRWYKEMVGVAARQGGAA